MISLYTISLQGGEKRFMYYSPPTIPGNFPCLPFCLLPLIRPLPPQHHPHRTRQDVKVQPDRPVADVILIPDGAFDESGSVAHRDLPQAGDAGKDAAVVGEAFAVHCTLLREESRAPSPDLRLTPQEHRAGNDAHQAHHQPGDLPVAHATAFAKPNAIGEE